MRYFSLVGGSLSYGQIPPLWIIGTQEPMDKINHTPQLIYFIAAKLFAALNENNIMFHWFQFLTFVHDSHIIGHKMNIKRHI